MGTWKIAERRNTRSRACHRPRRGDVDRCGQTASDLVSQGKTVRRVGPRLHTRPSLKSRRAPGWRYRTTGTRDGTEKGDLVAALISIARCFRHLASNDQVTTNPDNSQHLQITGARQCSSKAARPFRGSGIHTQEPRPDRREKPGLASREFTFPETGLPAPEPPVGPPLSLDKASGRTH